MKHSHQGKQRTQSKYKGLLNAKMFLCAFLCVLCELCGS
jgi:hypothetical protein